MWSRTARSTCQPSSVRPSRWASATVSSPTSRPPAATRKICSILGRRLVAAEAHPGDVGVDVVGAGAAGPQVDEHQVALADGRGGLLGGLVVRVAGVAVHRHDGRVVVGEAGLGEAVGEEPLDLGLLRLGARAAAARRCARRRRPWRRRCRRGPAGGSPPGPASSGRGSAAPARPRRPPGRRARAPPRACRRRPARGRGWPPPGSTPWPAVGEGGSAPSSSASAAWSDCQEA